MSIVLPISCCRYNHRERAVNGRPLSSNTNALSHVQLPTAAAIDGRPTTLQRPTDTRWCSKESNVYIHRHSTTLVHAHIYAHTHTYTDTRVHTASAHLVISRLTSGQVSLSVSLLRLVASRSSDSRLSSTVYRVDHASICSIALFSHHPTLAAM